MTKRISLLIVLSLLALALFAPAALAQDDDYGDDDDATATATASPLPDTGGPALALPAAGLLLVGTGAAGLVAARLNR